MAGGRKVSISGGDNIARALREIGDRMTGSVRVGFLEGSTYPEDYSGDNKRLMKLRKARAAQKVSAANAENIRRRIVGLNVKPVPKARVSNPVGPPKPRGTLQVAQVAFWDEYGTKRSKARPFFRQTIAEHSGSWGGDLAKIAKANGYDGPATLATMGTRIKDQIVTSIKKWPADNHPTTVAVKGFNKGLIDKGIMQRAVDFEVDK